MAVYFPVSLDSESSTEDMGVEDKQQHDVVSEAVVEKRAEYDTESQLGVGPQNGTLKRQLTNRHIAMIRQVSTTLSCSPGKLMSVQYWRCHWYWSFPRYSRLAGNRRPRRSFAWLCSGRDHLLQRVSKGRGLSSTRVLLISTSAQGTGNLDKTVLETA